MLERIKKSNTIFLFVTRENTTNETKHKRITWCMSKTTAH